MPDQGSASEALLDERGRPCPAPVLALGRFAAQKPPGTDVVLLADDPASQNDVAVWCRMRGAELLSVTEEGGSWTFRIRLSGLRSGGF